MNPMVANVMIENAMIENAMIARGRLPWNDSMVRFDLG
jgi:hypothetical protein